METVIACVIAAFIAVFLLSVFAPMHSDKPFWRAVYKVRGAMDAVSYWFMTGCLLFAAASGVIYAVWSFL